MKLRKYDFHISSISRVVGLTVVQLNHQSAINQQGDYQNHKYNLIKYRDYTGYVPKNTPYKLEYLDNWQPLLETDQTGKIWYQTYQGAQNAKVRPFSYNYVRELGVLPPPVQTFANSPELYWYKNMQMLNRSALLTDKLKMTAEFFNNKIQALGQANVFLNLQRNLTIHDFAKLDLAFNLAIQDGEIATWYWKTVYDQIRPQSSIQNTLSYETLRAWGGPYLGTVNDLQGRDWASYLPTDAFPEYPSGTTCFCASFAQTAKLFFGNDTFGWSPSIFAGSSFIEPGLTPATNITLGPWNTFSDLLEDCRQSRAWGGVHYEEAITNGIPLCQSIATRAFLKAQQYWSGTN